MCDSTARRVSGVPMTGIIIVLLIIWLVLVVLGAVLEGLFWLTVIGIVLFLGTAAYGWVKRKTA